MAMKRKERRRRETEKEEGSCATGSAPTTSPETNIFGSEHVVNIGSDLTTFPVKNIFQQVRKKPRRSMYFILHCFCLEKGKT